MRVWGNLASYLDPWLARAPTGSRRLAYLGPNEGSVSPGWGTSDTSISQHCPYLLSCMLELEMNLREEVPILPPYLLHSWIRLLELGGRHVQTGDSEGRGSGVSSVIIASHPSTGKIIPPATLHLTQFLHTEPVKIQMLTCNLFCAYLQFYITHANIGHITPPAQCTAMHSMTVQWRDICYAALQCSVA